MKKPNKNHIWVIEILDPDYPGQGWHPCSACDTDRRACCTNRKETRLMQREWEKWYRYDKFRIRKYVSQD